MLTTDKPALCLEGELTIYNAAETKLRLLEAVTRAEAPQIDLSAITELDTAGLQLLILAKEEAGRQGKTLRYVNHSRPVLEVLDFCNVAGRFGDPVLLTADA